MSPASMGAMAGMAAMGVEMSEVANFAVTEGVSSVIVQATPNEYQP
jgi:hypothetical protein